MNIRPRFTPEETRDRILKVGEELFRRIGYAKTTMADIAAALEMSPANVYRFFASKSAVNEAICRRMLAEAHVQARAVVARPGGAAERLETLVIGMHHYNRKAYVGDRRMFDMVEAAMVESWGVIEEHIHVMEEIVSGVVAEGVASGEFRDVDPMAAAKAFLDAQIKAVHPTLISMCLTNKPNEDLEASARAVVRLTLAGLANPARA